MTTVALSDVLSFTSLPRDFDADLTWEEKQAKRTAVRLGSQPTQLAVRLDRIEAGLVSK